MRIPEICEIDLRTYSMLQVSCGGVEGASVSQRVVQDGRGIVRVRLGRFFTLLHADDLILNNEGGGKR